MSAVQKLVDLIISFCDNDEDLAHCCLASRTLFSSAQPRLYRSIQLELDFLRKVDGTPAPLAPTSPTHELYHTLLRHRHLRQLVKRLSIKTWDLGHDYGVAFNCWRGTGWAQSEIGREASPLRETAMERLLRRQFEQRWLLAHAIDIGLLLVSLPQLEELIMREAESVNDESDYAVTTSYQQYF
ncbi:hypothetical protein JCM11641_006433 [Rhodosporidiobolus odoratus]